MQPNNQEDVEMQQFGQGNRLYLNNLLYSNIVNNPSIGTTSRSDTQSNRSKIEEPTRRLDVGSSHTQIPTAHTVLLGSVSNYNSHSAFRQTSMFEIQQQQQHAFHPTVNFSQNNPSIGTTTRLDTQIYSSKLEEPTRRLDVGSSHTQIPTTHTFPLGSTSNYNSHSAFRQNFMFEIQPQQQHAFHPVVDFSQNNNLSIPGSVSRSLPQNYNYNTTPNHMRQFHIGSSSSSSTQRRTPFVRQNSPFTIQQPFNATYIAVRFKKLQDEKLELGQKVEHHQESIDYFKACDKKLDDEINKCKSACSKISLDHKIPDEDGETENVTINNILKYEHSAAALFCRIKYKIGGTPGHSLFKDVIGVVAMLGATDDDRLSSILSEYLGLENMLAVVCKTPEGLKALESYNADGIPIEEPLQVICLDNFRPYPGSFVEGDPHRRLKLVKPRLENGETPTGFLGFAVNMVFINKSDMLCMSKAGNTLRETLFYHLFLNLQVYRSKEEMLLARPFIGYGAVSLDGGMIREKGGFIAGHQKRDIDVKFPIRSKGPFYAEEYYEMENTIKDSIWQKKLTLEDLQMEQKLLDDAKNGFEFKKAAFNVYQANAPPYATQGGRPR